MPKFLIVFLILGSVAFGQTTALKRQNELATVSWYFDQTKTAPKFTVVSDMNHLGQFTRVLGTIAGNQRQFSWRVKFDGSNKFFVRVRTGGVDGPISDPVTIQRR